MRSNDMSFQIASVYAFRGDADKTFEWLEQAYKNKTLVPWQSWTTPSRASHDQIRTSERSAIKSACLSHHEGA
jgi:hypothetical protein